MSVYLYDKSLVKSLREVTGDNRIHIIEPDKSISFLAQTDRDKVMFPAIVLSRGTVSLQEYQNQVVALKGQTAKVDDESFVVKAQLIPIRIEWNIDIFAVDRFTCDEIVRELVFYFITNPRFIVEVPYQLGITQNFDVFLEDEIVDNSDLIEFDNRGECFRETLTIYTENAHFFSSKRQYQTSIAEPEVCTNNFRKGDLNRYGKN